MTTPRLIWFRQDLRLSDHPALTAALAEAAPVLPVFVLDDAAAGALRPGGASRWWLRGSLAALAADLAARGSPLLLARGRAEIVLPALADAIGASEVHAGRAHEPWAREQSRRVHEALHDAGRALHLHTTRLLREPHGFGGPTGKPYAVYTPFAKAMMAAGEPDAPLPAPGRIPSLPAPGGEPLDALRLYPVPGEPDWAAQFPDTWQPGEAAAQARLARFATQALGAYDTQRNLPGIEGSSGLSPHLHFGEISPRAVWHAVRGAGASAGGAEVFLKEILWREFSAHLLWHHPDLPTRPLRAEFAGFPFVPDPATLAAWQRGRTGYPLVDAGMRQLWNTGWMHNRVRMICASFLIKHLLQPWQDGFGWFWDTLVDADLASNAASWQWVTGSGSDAAPFFRVFNPIIQGRKFDPDGAYVRRFLPELAGLPDAFIHAPWDAPGETLAAAGVVLGETYPRPIVEHAEARARALAAFATLQRAPGPITTP